MSRAASASFEEQPGPRMIREHVENPPVALPRLFVLLHVFVQHAQVQQRADVRRKLRRRPLVQDRGRSCRCRGDRFPAPGRTGRRAWLPSAATARSKQRNDFARIAAHRRNGRGTLIQILGRLFDGAGQLVEHVDRFLRPAVVAQRFGLRQRHLIARIAGLLGRLVGGQRFGVLIERQIGFAQIEMGERAAVAVRERFDRVAVAAQQIQADAQPGRRRRAAVRLLFQLGRRFAQLAIVA